MEPTTTPVAQEGNPEPRKRRSSSERISDLQAKIQGIKDRDDLKAAGETPAVKALIRVLMSIKRAGKIAGEERDAEAGAAFQAAGDTILAELQRRGVKLPAARNPKDTSAG